MVDVLLITLKTLLDSTVCATLKNYSPQGPFD